MRSNHKTIVLTGMFAALIFVTIFFISIPTGFGGVIHFGDSLIFLAAVMLPFPYGLVAAGVGAGLFNLVRIPMWFPFTIVIKPIMALCFTSKGETLLGPLRNKIAPFVAGALNVVLYFPGYMLLAYPGGWAVAWAAVPGQLVQAGGSIIFFFILAGALDRLGVKGRFLL